MEKVLDSLGRQINVGDTIAYCVGAGRAQVQNFYEVVEFVPNASMYMEGCTKIKAKFVGGHAWRSGRPSPKLSNLEFPRERAILMPKDLKLPEVWPA